MVSDSARISAALSYQYFGSFIIGREIGINVLRGSGGGTIGSPRS